MVAHYHNWLIVVWVSVLSKGVCQVSRSVWNLYLGETFPLTLEPFPSSPSMRFFGVYCFDSLLVRLRDTKVSRIKGYFGEKGNLLYYPPVNPANCNEDQQMPMGIIVAWMLWENQSLSNCI